MQAHKYKNYKISYNSIQKCLLEVYLEWEDQVRSLLIR